MIGWNFPLNGGGIIRGFADSGIENFIGKEISSLARETCQNSLDAVADENFAVTVEFQRCEVAVKDIPDIQNYEKILQACQAFWSGNVKAAPFFKEAFRRLNFEKISVLRISDFNTTGLAEPFNPCAMKGWNTLTKIDGGATKTGDSAGSFGIGKNAPFANSFWRMIFYRTLNLKGEHAAQGMSRLMSFELDDKNISAGVGYCGDTQGNMPVPKIDALDEICPRTKRGTDIFVYGFNGENTWQEEIIQELTENFLVAIHRDKLRVKVQGIAIDKNNLDKFVTNHAANYYKILSGEKSVKFFEKGFYGMGKLKLGVLLDAETKLNRKVLIVRKSGMKLFELDRFPRTLNFTAILELEGRELNSFFREMEPPTHDKWEPTRYEKNRPLAKKYLAELKDWVRKKISTLGAENISDEVNVEGLSNMLDFDDGAIAGSSQKAEETLDSVPKPDNLPQKLSKENFGDKNISKTQRTRGDITDNAGDESAVRTLGGKRKRKNRTAHTGQKNPDGENTILEPVGRKITCDKIRVIRVGEKKFRLILKVPQNISGGRLEIFAIGENNSGEKLFVAAAKSVDSNVEIHAADDKICFKNLRATVEAKIFFELQDAGNYALGVNVYED